MQSVWLAEPGEAGVVGGLLVQFRDYQARSSPSDGSFLVSVELLIERTDTEYLLAAGAAEGPPDGVCQLRFRHSVWTGADDCWLEDLFVSREARRSGLGRALVTAALERARQRGCRRVELDTNEDNESAIRLYESLGFSATSKGPSRSLFLGLRLDG
jgi:ribosomal protein S18 acetylase RimI-like enzyme